jgi:hypothetical protein
MADTQGHRANDYDEFWESASCWWQWETLESGEKFVRWMVRPPCGHHFLLAGGAQEPPHHDVEEHEDGAISVVPQPGNSNSILCPHCGWHGYIYAGVWREC